MKRLPTPAARRLPAALLTLALLAAAACSSISKTGAGGVDGRKNAFTTPHVLRLADTTDFSSLNPMLTAQLQLGLLSELTMAYLVRYDAHNLPVPELATEVPTAGNGGISKDGLTYTYHLRHGVKWSDGAPFDARDVLFTTKLVLDPKTNVTGRDGWDRITSTTAPDPYTVVFRLRAPYSPFVSTVFSSAGANPAILPLHVLAHTSDINRDPYDAKPIGIGPFRYVSWTRGDRVVMERNPYYWRGRAKLDRVVYEIIPNRDTVMSQMQTGNVDLWALAPRKYYPRLIAIPGFAGISQPSYLYGHIDFNLAHPVTSDPVVREALRLGTNRQLLIDKAGSGIGTVQDGFESAASPWYDPSIPITPYDPKRANAMLDADGWVRGAGGIRAKDGVRLSLDFASNTGSPDTDTMIETLRTMWQGLGVEFVRKNYAPSLLFAQYQDGGIIYSGKWDAVTFVWQAGVFPDENGIYGCGTFPPKGQNAMHWCDPRAQAAMDAILRTTDPAELKRQIDVVQERFAADVPSIVLAIYKDLYVHNVDLKDFHPNQVTPFDDMMRVDI